MSFFTDQLNKYAKAKFPAKEDDPYFIGSIVSYKVFDVRRINVVSLTHEKGVSY